MSSVLQYIKTICASIHTHTHRIPKVTFALHIWRLNIFDGFGFINPSALKLFVFSASVPGSFLLFLKTHRPRPWNPLRALLNSLLPSCSLGSSDSFFYFFFHD